MAAGFTSNLLVFMSIMVATMHIHDTAAQTTHIVGDTLGWTIPPGGAAAYTTWASQQTFSVGDVLVFNFTNGQHDVAEVSAAAYEPCSSTNAISLATTSPASLTLTSTGMHYYICTFTSHCQIGQKLTINVPASPNSPPSTTPTRPASPPATTPAPPSMTPTTPVEPCPPTSSPTSSPLSPPTSTTNTVNTPPTPSGAPSFPVVLLVTILAIGLAVLNY